jgi:hypothetical protein
MDQDGFGKSYKRTFKLVRRDILYAAIGLLVSIILAISINPDINNEIMELIGF